MDYEFVKVHLPAVAAILMLVFLAPPVITSSVMVSLHLYNALSPTNCVQKKWLNTIIELKSYLNQKIWEYISLFILWEQIHNLFVVNLKHLKKQRIVLECVGNIAKEYSIMLRTEKW